MMFDGVWWCLVVFVSSLWEGVPGEEDQRSRRGTAVRHEGEEELHTNTVHYGLTLTLY